MKIGIFIDNFFEAQRYKDPGIIAIVLFNLGHQVTIYCLNTNSTELNGIVIKKLSKKESEDAVFWEKEESNQIILYSWLSLRFSSLIKALKQSNKKIILKLDSDGHLIYPLKPTYLRSFGRDNSIKQLAIHVIRFFQWSIFSKLNSKKRIRQLCLCDAAIIESPLAIDNMRSSLKKWQQENLADKIYFVPDPVSFDIISENKRLNEKEDIIISIGRWDDKQKNKSGLIKVISQSDLSGWKIIIIGKGSSKIRSLLKKINLNLNIEAFEEIEHKLIGAYLKNAKIIFAPSNHESFNIAVAEAFCNGCSLAGTPLESFFYFSNQGKFGTIAKNFKTIEIKKALEEEISKWNNNKYNPEETSKYWREQLSPEIVGKSIESLLKKYED